jgi:SpoIIAA-like
VLSLSIAPDPSGTFDVNIPEVAGRHIFYDRPGVATVSWDPTWMAVHTEWHGYADPTEFADVLEAGLLAIREHRCSNGLVDGRNQKVIPQPVQDWIDQDWFPRALAAGLRRLALVIPNSGLARMNIEDVLHRVPGTRLDIAYFATLEEAVAWITRPSTSPPPSERLTEQKLPA